MSDDECPSCGQTNEEIAEELGWLDEGGLCKLPPDVVAACTGFKAPAIRVDKLNAKQLQGAIDKGYIKFLDGNGDPYTFAEYCTLYQGYPDPVWQLEMTGRWPPKGIVHIGGK